MYIDRPHAREAGHVAEAAGVATPAGVMEALRVTEALGGRHDVPPDVLTSVVHWLWKSGKGCATERTPFDELEQFRRDARDGAKYCHNDGCEVVGHLKDFKLCPQCRRNRYCGDACQKVDWTTGGHKLTCGTYITRKD